MMQNPKTHENYPCRIVLISNLVSIGIDLTGGFILYQLGLVWLLIYALYIVALYIRLMKKGCIHCYYYGKTCAFGTGKISALFFKKGDPHKFISKKMTWWDLIPDLLVSLVPFAIGMALLILRFNWPVLIAVVTLVVLTSFGNGWIRGSLACKFCKQRELGCPAERLFKKKNKAKV